MPIYMNLGGDSNVASYEEGADFIRVTFKAGGTYEYTNASAGAANIAQMKILARAGQGLSSYISRYVRKAYASKM